MAVSGTQDNGGFSLTGKLGRKLESDPRWLRDRSRLLAGFLLGLTYPAAMFLGSWPLALAGVGLAAFCWGALAMSDYAFKGGAGVRFPYLGGYVMLGGFACLFSAFWVFLFQTLALAGR